MKLGDYGGNIVAAFLKCWYKWVNDVQAIYE
jgi:hypothetical protein